MPVYNFGMADSLEEGVQTIYLSVDITRLEYFNISSIMAKVSRNFDIQLNYYYSAVNNFGGKFNIFINQNQLLLRQWQDFGYELGHILYHEGSQLMLLPSFPRLPGGSS